MDTSVVTVHPWIRDPAGQKSSSVERLSKLVCYFKGHLGVCSERHKPRKILSLTAETRPTETFLTRALSTQQRNFPLRFQKVSHPQHCENSSVFTQKRKNEWQGCCQLGRFKNHIPCIAYAASYILQLNKIIKAMAQRDKIHPINSLLFNISKTWFGRTEFPHWRCPDWSFTENETRLDKVGLCQKSQVSSVHMAM